MSNLAYPLSAPRYPYPGGEEGPRPAGMSSPRTTTPSIPQQTGGAPAFRASSPSADNGSGLAAALAALNPSGVSSLAPGALPGLPPLGTAPTAGQAGATTPYDFNADPVFQQTNALIARTEEEARSQALARKTQLAIQYGDAAGLGLSKSTQEQASQNPFSVLSSLHRGYDSGVSKLEDALNKGNLFYSGWRGKQLSDAATGYQQNRYNAQSRFQATIQDVDNALQQALLQAEWQRLAYLQGQYGGGGGGGGPAPGGAPGAPAGIDPNSYNPAGTARPGAYQAQPYVAPGGGPTPYDYFHPDPKKGQTVYPYGGNPWSIAGTGSQVGHN